MARDLRDLPRRQIGVNFLGQLLAFFLQPRNFFGNIQRRIVLHEAQFLDLGFEFGNRLFEFEKSDFHTVAILKRTMNDTAVRAAHVTGRRRIARRHASK